ncbi:hypothetical protein DPEC_G00021910 [Dallia pectoralis]|uniref:Uncharacterized protein n=1 Tax=Dallia pectoralis TaxID=75939 RepID=A0ACC2HH21_DALPE|nr:hypothetical protein DPEC_G00021910 [Dallia pectoralis]
MTDAETRVLPADAGSVSNLPDFKKKTRLYCKNGGYHLVLLPDGTVGGVRDEGKYTVLRVKSVTRGVVVIQGDVTERYLAMSDEGKLHSSLTVTDECHFLEKMEENHYNTYQSQKYSESSWYVALKKNGKPKLGPRTHIGQKAIFFLPRRLENSGK